MTVCESVEVHVSNKTIIHLTPLVPDKYLETLQTRIECESVPDWLSIDVGEDSVATYLNNRQSIAEIGSGNAKATFVAEDINELPTELQDAVADIEEGEVALKDVSIADGFEFPSRDRCQLRFLGVINEKGELSPLSVQLEYNEDSFGCEHVRTFADGDIVENGLELSHNDVVKNADECMDWVGENEMESAIKYANRDQLNGVFEDDEWLEFLWLAGVQGQARDGHFENKSPPHDYTELLAFEGTLGRLMYYGYRYHGWDYSIEQLESDLEQLSHV